VLIGFGGVLLIARPWDVSDAVDPQGVLFMLLGSASVGVSFVYARKFISGLGIAPAALTTYQMGLALLTLAVITNYDGITAIREDTRAALGLVVGLGLLGTGVAYILYYFIVDRLVPLRLPGRPTSHRLSLMIGWLLVGEPLSIMDGLGVLLNLTWCGDPQMRSGRSGKALATHE
jgi:drug/metabolite transporter (DMT)-like permease